jgi:hypothetical protein
MVDTTTQESIVRESPEIEAYKLALLKTAQTAVADPLNLPKYMVASQSPDQLAAKKLAETGIGSYQPYLNAGQKNFDTAGGAQGFGGLADIGKQAVGYGLAGAQGYDPNMAKEFMNPYQQNVTNEALKEMQRNADIQKSGLNAQAVKSGAFGGSRQGIQQTELGRNLYDIQSKRLFEDYANNYNQALGASMTSFENQQKRAQNLGNIALGAGNLQATGASGIAALGNSEVSLGQQVQALGQNDASFLSQFGDKDMNYQQKVLDATRANAMQEKMDPFQRLSYLSDIYKGAPSSSNSISQGTTPSASSLSQIAGAGIAATGMYNLATK